MKIKLRDLTEEQYKKYFPVYICGNGCDNCVFKNVPCMNTDKAWVHHKDLYSDKFLDQEIDTLPLKPRLTNEERKYLKAVLKHIKCGVDFVQKMHTLCGDAVLLIMFKTIDNYTIPLSLDYFKDMQFEGLADNYKYKLEDLDL